MCRSDPAGSTGATGRRGSRTRRLAQRVFSPRTPSFRRSAACCHGQPAGRARTARTRSSPGCSGSEGMRQLLDAGRSLPTQQRLVRRSSAHRRIGRGGAHASAPSHGTTPLPLEPGRSRARARPAAACDARSPAVPQASEVLPARAEGSRQGSSRSVAGVIRCFFSFRWAAWQAHEECSSRRSGASPACRKIGQERVRRRASDQRDHQPDGPEGGGRGSNSGSARRPRGPDRAPQHAAAPVGAVARLAGGA